MTTPILFTAIGVVAFIVLVLLVSYVKCPPNQAYIISGLGKKPKVLIGKSGFRVPFLQRLDKISLELISIDVKTSTYVPTADFINIKVDSVVNVKVSDTPELIEQAQQHFLNMNTDDIAAIAREVLEGNLREIVGTMSLPDMVTNRKAFADKVQENAVDDLKRMGLVITSFNIQNFYDENNVIENLGVDNVVKISKQANIARAESERDIAVAKAKAEKDANDARIESETAIAIKNNEYALKKAALDTKENSAKAVADAAYSIQEQEQRKSVEIATAEANLARQEKEILLKQKEVEIAEQKLSAEIEKKADAEKYAAQARADADLYARQKDAEAKAFELQKAAEAEAFQKQKAAEAEKVAMEAEAAGKKALAEAIQAQGEAEANAIQAKLLAEAEGIEKRADALAKMNETGKLQMQLDVLGKLFDNLPTIAGEISKPLQSIDSITMYGDGNVEKLAKELTTTTDAMSKGLLGSLGVDLKSLVGSVLGGMSQTTTEATE
jgi:flotillin